MGSGEWGLGGLVAGSPFIINTVDFTIERRYHLCFGPYTVVNNYVSYFIDCGWYSIIQHIFGASEIED